MDAHGVLMLKVQFHSTVELASKFTTAMRGPLKSPPSPNPFLVPAHTLALVLPQDQCKAQITQEPFTLQTWKRSPLFFGRFVFCHCSALNWLLSGQRSLSECFSSAEHTKERWVEKDLPWQQ